MAEWSGSAKMTYRDYWLHLYVRTDGNPVNNTTPIAWELYATGTYGAYGNYATNWRTSINGYVSNGEKPSFSGNRIVLQQGVGSIEHNADGRKEIWVDGWWDSRHSNIGSASVGFGIELPRIPKPPSAPTVGAPTNITTTSARVPYTVGAEQGAAITQTLMQWRRAADGVVVWEDRINTRASGYSEPVGAGVKLAPGTEYIVRAMSDAYGIGWSGWSNEVRVRTLSAANVGKGGSFPPAASVLSGKGNAFVVPQVLVGKGGSFVNAG